MLLNALIGDAARRDIGLCLMSGTTIRRDASTSAIMWHPPRRKLRLADALASRALRADAMESITGGWLSFVKLIGFLAQHARGAGGSMT